MMQALSAKKILRIATMTGIFAAQCLYARLGETETACDARYNPHGGDVREVSADTKSTPTTAERKFSYQGWVVAINFRDGRASRLEFQHENGKFVAAWNKGITAEEANAILGANSSGRGWREVPPEQLKNPTGNTKIIKSSTRCQRLWFSADGAIAYIGGLAGGSFCVEDRLYVQQRYFPQKKVEAKPASTKPVPTF